MNEKGFAVWVFLVYLILVCFGIGGWVNNLLQFAKLDFEAPYKAEIIRGVGVVPFAPLGAVLGYVEIKDN